MANVTSAAFTFVSSTYSGANVIGTSTKTATGTINANIVPSISSVTLAEANADVPSGWGYIKGVSKITGTITAVAGNGASIASYSTSINGTRYTSQTFTTEVLNTSGTNTISVTVTDSRGRTATYSSTFNVVDYEKPYITSFYVTRTGPTTATLKIVGGVYAINNKNTYSYKYKYKKKADTTYTEVAITNAAYTIDKTIELTGLEDVRYDFIGIITDKFNEFSKETTLATTRKIFNVRPDGEGFALFKKSEKEGLEIAKPIYDEFETKIGNGLSVYRPDGTDIDPNTTLEELVLTETNTPGGFHYIRTMFYATKSQTANRTQIAYPYAYDANTKKALYTRAYVNGIGWSEWAYVGSEVNASDYAGLFQSGKELKESGWVTITPTAANTPTAVNVAFKKAYNKIPVVIPIASSGVIGTQVLGASVNGISKTSVNVVLTRTNTTPTTIYYFVLGEV